MDSQPRVNSSESRGNSNLKLRIRNRRDQQIRANSGRIRIRANSCEFAPASLPLGSGYTATREGMGSRPPSGWWVPKHGPSPRPGRRMAQEAFEAYGKSSPLPALPHHPFPPGYVPPPVSMATGGSRHGTLSTMRRRGHYRQGATAAGDPEVPSLYHGEGRECPEGKPPPPAAAKCLTPCLCRACVVPATCV